MKKWIVLSIILVIIVTACIFVSSFRLTEVQVTGCENVDEQIVKDAVLKNKYSDNTIFLYLYNKFKPIGDIPFVEKLEVEFVSKNSVAITVYEKAIAGCVEYMNEYIFFDKDGVVLESASDMVRGVPCIKGLKFGEWVMGEKLPVEDASKFHSILTITQLIDKYGLSIDGIKFTSENELVLIYKDIMIELGAGENLAIQMMNLGSILEGLEGKAGTLYMKDFDENNVTASFKEKGEKVK